MRSSTHGWARIVDAKGVGGRHQPKVIEFESGHQVGSLALARMCNLDPTYCGRVLRGIVKPTLDTAWIMAKGLGMSLDDFYLMLKRGKIKQKAAAVVESMKYGN